MSISLSEIYVCIGTSDFGFYSRSCAISISYHESNWSVRKRNINFSPWELRFKLENCKPIYRNYPTLQLITSLNSYIGVLRKSILVKYIPSLAKILKLMLWSNWLTLLILLITKRIFKSLFSAIFLVTIFPYLIPTQ